MKIKKLISLVEIFAMTGLVSVGFSSWLIVESNPISLSGNIVVEEVINYNEYITIKNMTFSDYDASGFYNDYVYSTDTSTRLFTANLEADMIIDLTKCRNMGETLTFVVELSQDISNISFNMLSNSNVPITKKYSYNYDGGTSSEILNVQYNALFSNPIVTLTDETPFTNNTNASYLNIHMTYVFNFSNLNNFTTYFYDKVKGKGLDLNITATLGGN